MVRTYSDSGCTDLEIIEVLTAISEVSARTARNMSILANLRQTEKGAFSNEQNARYGVNHQRTSRCSN